MIPKTSYQKNFPIIFIAFLLIGLLAPRSAYPIQKCQNIQTSIKIINEAGGREISGTDVDSLVSSPGSFIATSMPFQNYVTTVSKHVINKIGKTSQCKSDTSNPPKLELFFVYRPLVKQSNLLFDFKPPKSKDARSLDSPWVKMSKSRSPNLSVRAVFVWSERQFLFDQALMAGSSASPTNLLPIDKGAYDRYLRDYTSSVILATSFKAALVAQKSISKRLPVEIFWLFTHAWQSSFAPFSMEVDYALSTTAERVEVGYINLSNALVDRFLASSKSNIHYSTVIELKKEFDIGKYRVNKLH